MIMICDVEVSDHSRRFRDFLLRCKIPCALIHTCDFNKPAQPLVIVFFTYSDYDTYVNSVHTDPESALIYDTAAGNKYEECLRVYHRILDVLDVKYSLNPDSFFADRYSDICGKQRYFGKFIHLTDTQSLIVKHLAVRNGSWCSAAEIGDYCLNKGDIPHLVSSHISNINRFCSANTGKEMIKTDRKLGYSFKNNKVL